MEADIKELKALVRHNTELAEETNRLVRKLRRGIWWGRFLTLVWWLVVLGVTGAAYVYFLQPYVDYAGQLFGQAQGLQEQVSGFIERFGATRE